MRSCPAARLGCLLAPGVPSKGGQVGPVGGTPGPSGQRKLAVWTKCWPLRGASDGFARGCGEPASHPQGNQERGMHTVPTCLRAYTRYPDNPHMTCEAGPSSLPHWTYEETEVLRDQSLSQGQARHACCVEAHTQALLCPTLCSVSPLQARVLSRTHRPSAPRELQPSFALHLLPPAPLPPSLLRLTAPVNSLLGVSIEKHALRCHVCAMVSGWPPARVMQACACTRRWFPGQRKYQAVGDRKSSPTRGH